MSEKKIILDKFKGELIHNPPDEFTYEDGKYIVMININERTYIVRRTDRRVLFVSDVDIIKEWLKENSIDSQWPEWEKIIIPIIRYFEIPKSDRIELYKIFKMTTKTKLEKAKRKVKKYINMLDKDWPILISERYFFDARLNGYTYFLNSFKNKRSGHDKFLPEIIRPLFDKLNQLDIPAKRQNEIVASLFRLGEFDDFQNYYPIDEDTALNKINKIRSRVLTP